MIDTTSNSAYVKKFLQFLEQQHFRKTPERFVVLDKAMKMQHVFTIEQLGHEVEQGGYMVSRATLYNNVELLVQAELLHKLNYDGQHTYYEKLSLSRYTHLVCQECGKVKVVKDNTFVAYMNAKTYTAFTSRHFSLCVYGICNSCARRLKKQRLSKNQQFRNKINKVKQEEK